MVVLPITAFTQKPGTLAYDLISQSKTSRQTSLSLRIHIGKLGIIISTTHKKNVAMIKSYNLHYTM